MTVMTKKEEKEMQLLSEKPFLSHNEKKRLAELWEMYFNDSRNQ